MKYENGNVVYVGDCVESDDGICGEVVFSIDTNEYSPGFKREEWEYLGKGVMLRLNDGTLLFYEDGVFKKTNEI
jgi:hypothetical protein